MPTFEFEDGTAQASSPITPATGTTPSITVANDGVNFTWSVIASGNLFALFHYPSINDGYLAGNFHFTGSKIYELDAIGGGGGGGGGDLSFTGGVSLNITRNVTLFGSAGNGVLTVTFHHVGGGTSKSTLTGGNTGVVTGTGNIASITFSTSIANGWGFNINDITTNIACFLGGTLIETANGPRPVETLNLGDKITTADGGTTRVKWLGQQPINGRLLHPGKVNPICIGAGAIADGVPARDLFVSPDHAIEIDGILVNASALVNGTSIRQAVDMPLDGFTYYHVETEAHELILAEGCSAESYLDLPDRSAFSNGSERANAPAIAEMPLPRITTRRLLPAAIASRLRNRATDIKAA